MAIPRQVTVNIPTQGREFHQIARRGWNEQAIRDTFRHPFATRQAVNTATGNAATAYHNQDGSYVVVDDVTEGLVQLSDRTNPWNWIADPTIVDPYIP